MPVAVTPPLTPIEEEREAGLPSPLQPKACKCCQCNLLNYFFDDNHAWFNRLSEHCLRLDCLHARCAACFDPGPAHRPIPHLFEELQESLEGSHEDSEAVVGGSDRDGSCSTATTIAESSSSSSSPVDVSSDEDLWRAILDTATLSSPPLPPQGVQGSASGLAWPCPLREAHLCPGRFDSEEAAWQHSSCHVGQEAVRCALQGCRMTFLGKEAMRLHYVAMHS